MSKVLTREWGFIKLKPKDGIIKKIKYMCLLYKKAKINIETIIRFQMSRDYLPTKLWQIKYRPLENSHSVTERRPSKILLKQLVWFWKKIFNPTPSFYGWDFMNQKGYIIKQNKPNIYNIIRIFVKNNN